MLPLPVLAIAAPMEKNGYKTLIIDQRTDKNWPDLLETALANNKIICVGISSMTGPQIAGGIAASKVVKRVSPETPVVWGGVHPSLMPEQTVQSEFVDIAVIGESEEAFLELVQKLEHKQSIDSVNGLCYKANGRVICTPCRELLDVEKLLLPAYHLVDIDRYHTPDLFSTSTPGIKIPFISSRGCSYRCTYCYNIAYNKRKFRGMSPEKVVDQIATIVDRYDTSNIFLLDDNFFNHPQRTRKICELLVKNSINITLHNVNVRADCIIRYNQEFLDYLYDVGVRKLFIGCESGSDEILKIIHKDSKKEHVIKANRKLRKTKIEPVYSFMVGFPSENINQVKETLALMEILVETNPSAKVVLALFSPFPGTPLFDVCIRKGMPYPKSLEDWIDLEYSKINYTQSNKTREEIRFMENAYRFTHFLNRDIYSGESGLLKRTLASFYSKIIRFRVKHSFYFFMPEMFLRKIIKHV
jgi:radical SAM superfamily enzyme YgiQ (UPF0313 family)